MSLKDRWNHVSWTLRRRRAERELIDDLRTHIEMEIEDNLAAGLSPEEARRQANRAFGNVTLTRERIRDQWPLARIETVWQDVRYGVRLLARRPGFTALVLLVLGLGIGANSAVFTIVNSVLLRPLPYPDSDRLVMIFDVNSEQGMEEGPSPGNLLDWRRENRVFEGIGAWYAQQPRTLQGDFESEKVTVAQVTADFFPVFETQPLLGRYFHSDEVDRQAPVVVLSHRLWVQRFGGDPSAAQQEVTLDGVVHKIVGVMSSDFAVPNKEVGLWLPWDFALSYSRLPKIPRDYRFLRVVARLKPGTSLDAAQTELRSIAARLADSHPENKGWGVRLSPFRRELVGSVEAPLFLLFAAVGVVLLIACTNVANLLLARSMGRQREVAVRSAIGASRIRILRQLLTEGLLLAAGGGFLGLLVAHLGLETILSLAPSDLPRLDEVTIDWRVLGFTLLLTLLTSPLFGALPAWQSTRRDLLPGLRQGGPRASADWSQARSRNVLVVAEIAAAITLLVGAALLIQSFSRLLQVEPGFEPAGTLVLRVFPDAQKYNTVETRLDYFERVFERLNSLPGVVSAGAATGLPMNGFNNTPTFRFAPADLPFPENAPEAVTTMATVGYFRTMGMRLLRGRDIQESDRTDSTPVIVINETLARRTWPRENPIGKRLTLDYSNRGFMTFEVVGVVGDVRTQGLKRTPQAEIYRPHTQAAYVTMNIVIRSDGDPAMIQTAATRAILEADPTQPVHSVTTLDRLLAESVATERFVMFMLTVLAGLALVLAASGIYGLLSYSVRQRTREIGIRMTFGARSRDVLGMVLWQTARLVVLGASVGLLASMAVSSWLQTLLFEISPRDGATLVVVPWILLGVAVLAALVPARRATRVDAIRALRCE